jgi:hypothetical protein
MRSRLEVVQKALIMIYEARQEQPHTAIATIRRDVERRATQSLDYATNSGTVRAHLVGKDRDSVITTAKLDELIEDWLRGGDRLKHYYQKDVSDEDKLMIDRFFQKFRSSEDGGERAYEFRIPEEVDPELYEGETYQVTINGYERNPQARQRCISHYGVNCFICGFSFEKAYGEDAKGLIHVHHLRQLSEIRAEYKVDPVQDMRPVCPNCHAVIHRRKTAYTIDEVITMVDKSRQLSNKDHG